MDKPLYLFFVEGYSDIIIISKYIEIKYGFNYIRDDNKWPVHFKFPNKEHYGIYDDGSKFVALVAAGGSGTSFEKTYCSSMEDDFKNYEGEKFLIIVTDNDDNDFKSLANEINHFKEISFEHDKLVSFSLKNSYGQNTIVKTALHIIPRDSNGCLETIIMDSLKGTESEIVACSQKFIDGLNDAEKKYIKTRRLNIKAKLGTVFTLFNPEETFFEFCNRSHCYDFNGSTFSSAFNFLDQYLL